MCRGLEFDICEMAMTTYLCARALGKPFTAIPVFVTRNFHHWAIFTNAKSGISEPKDLEGRTVGVNRGYTVTTGLWARGMLQHEYGVDLDKMVPYPVVGERATNGGYCGPAVKPIALHMVASLGRDPQVRLPISGIGGITTWRDAAEFIALAKAHPGQLSYSSSGVGGTPHLTMELFKVATGIDVVHVPYKNSSQGFTDVAGGQIQSCFFTLPGLLPFVKSGRMRALAVSSAKRAEQLPNVPTIQESGVADFDVTVWQGIAVPAKTPKEIVAALHTATVAAVKKPEIAKRLLELGLTPVGDQPDEFAAFIRADIEKWRKIVQQKGLTAD